MLYRTTRHVGCHDKTYEPGESISFDPNDPLDVASEQQLTGNGAVEIGEGFKIEEAVSGTGTPVQAGAPTPPAKSKPIAAPKPDAPWHEGKNNTALFGIYTELGLSGLRANSKRADLIAAIEAKREEIAASATQGNDTAPGAGGNDTASAGDGTDTTAGAQGDDTTAGGAS
jgi:hypothetical protein